MEVRKDTLEKLVSLLEVASKDETRLYLNGVHIKRISENEVCLEATDSFCLTQFFVNDFKELERTIIESRSIKNLKVFLKDYKKTHLFEWSDNENHITIHTLDSDINLKKVHRDYPKTESVISNPKKIIRKYHLILNYF